MVHVAVFPSDVTRKLFHSELLTKHEDMFSTYAGQH